jgi:hypothetical protein
MFGTLLVSENLSVIELLNVEEGLEAKIHHLKFIEFEPLTYLPIQSKIVN